MSATTVKLEESLLKEIRAVKPHQQSLAAYVREALERDLRRRQLAVAAQQYQAFLEEHPDEREAMESWSEAPLARQRRKRRA